MDTMNPKKPNFGLQSCPVKASCSGSGFRAEGARDAFMAPSAKLLLLCSVLMALGIIED